MKRNSAKNKRERALERRLDLVRTTVRVLTPTELEQVAGGDTTKVQNKGTGCAFLPFTG